MSLIPHIPVEMVYILQSNGELQIHVKIDTSSVIAVLPRIGIQYQINHQYFSNISWLGSGPHECYPDRCTSSIEALHTCKISELYTPYIVPSENGNRTNISWIQLYSNNQDKIDSYDERSQKATSIRISSSNKFNFSAMPYTTEDLIQAKHSSELESYPRSFTSLNIDPFLMGVGGDDSWSTCVHDEYLLHPGQYSFNLQFTSI